MLIAVTGFAGAGKSTVIDHLEKCLPSRKVYVGRYVREEVERLGLSPGSANEEQVRQGLRAAEGLDALARRALDEVATVLCDRTALIDAIYVREEWALYRHHFSGRVMLIHVDTSFDIRAARLAKRSCRPLTVQELRDRDKFERDELQLESVFAIADRRLRNEDNLETLYSALNGLVSWLAPSLAHCSADANKEEYN